MPKKGPTTLNARIALCILIILIVINLLWIVRSRQSGPLIAVVLYSIIVFLILKKKDFQAGAIAGVLGFGIHVFELLLSRTRWLEGMDLVLFYINIFLPIPLIGFSILAHRENKQ